MLLNGWVNEVEAYCGGATIEVQRRWSMEAVEGCKCGGGGLLWLMMVCFPKHLWGGGSARQEGDGGASCRTGGVGEKIKKNEGDGGEVEMVMV
jgi:hypothetical protein